jgi:predicted NBD/HSP70 family sugar kinase
VERAGIVAVDLRPENTTVGLSGVDARFVRQMSWRTPKDPAAFVAAVVRSVNEFKAAYPHIVCEGMGVSLPGRVDQNGRLVFAPNLGWPTVDIRNLLETATNLPVVLENAANACALAEFWFGQHSEHTRHLIAVTVSEGIGVGLLLNGQLVHGSHSLAGEFGHVTVDEDGPPCHCGKSGCWERYASNAAAVEFYGGNADTPRPPFSFDDLIRSADSGDARAGAALDRMARYLGIGLAALVTGLAPELIVIIGEVTRVWPRVGPIVDEVIRKRTLAQSTVRIAPTDPAMQPRLRGAVTLVVQQHFGAPNVA